MLVGGTRLVPFAKLLVAAALTGLLAYFLFIHFSDIKRSVTARDSLAYWAAGRLLIESHNPYDASAVLQLERQSGYVEERPLVVRTPPWSLFMIAILGFLSPFWSWLLWMAVTLGCLVTGLRLCKRLYGGEPIPENLLSIVGYTFAPVPACLISGQMGLVLMLGLVLFLWWETHHPFLAGAALILPFAKPHLLVVFWIALFFWVVLRRKLAVAGGFLLALAAVSVIPLMLDPGIFRHYREMLRAASMQREFIPALSGVIRLIFFRRMFWVQFIPMLAALVWGALFFQQRFVEWSWRQHGPALLVASVLTTPYAWLADESVLLPAMLQAAAFAYQARAQIKIRAKIVLAILALLNFLLLLILRSRIPFATGIYFWSSLVWFFFYFYARSLRRQQLAVHA
jgi:Glycosyltransferase family 87